MWRKEKKKACPFFLLENSRPLSPWGPLDSLSTCLGTDSLTGGFWYPCCWPGDHITRFLGSSQRWTRVGTEVTSHPVGLAPRTWDFWCSNQNSLREARQGDHPHWRCLGTWPPVPQWLCQVGSLNPVLLASQGSCGVWCLGNCSIGL